MCKHGKPEKDLAQQAASYVFDAPQAENLGTMSHLLKGSNPATKKNYDSRFILQGAICRVVTLVRALQRSPD